MKKQSSVHDSFLKRRGHTLAALGAGVLLTTGCVLIFSKINHDSFSSVSQSERSTHYEYPVHRDITATIFWVGEQANTSNDFIHNRTSAWTKDWTAAYGGVDDPNDRCGYLPCGFTPNENPFYFALPFGDFDTTGSKPESELSIIPWYDQAKSSEQSLLKNRWIEVTYADTKAYAQWEDVGPFADNDGNYVFGSEKPKESRAGLDMSPALADYLGVKGRAVVSWRFIDATDVPAGEWTKIITVSGPKFN